MKVQLAPFFTLVFQTIRRVSESEGIGAPRPFPPFESRAQPFYNEFRRGRSRDIIIWSAS